MAANPNIDDDTRARARKFVAEKAASKPRVVGKKELADSGLSLRDFLNKERGLTRRKETNPTLGEAKDKAAQEAADAIDPGSNMMFKDVARNQYRDSGKEMVDKQDEEAANARSMSKYVPRRTPKLSNATKPGTATRYENTDTQDMSYKRGGKVGSASKRADGCAMRGKTRA